MDPDIKSDVKNLLDKMHSVPDDLPQYKNLDGQVKKIKEDQDKLETSKYLKANEIVGDYKVDRVLKYVGLSIALIQPILLSVEKMSVGEFPDFSDVNNTISYFYDSGNYYSTLLYNAEHAIGLGFMAVGSILQYKNGNKFKKLTGEKITRTTSQIVKEKAKKIKEALKNK